MCEHQLRAIQHQTYVDYPKKNTTQILGLLRRQRYLEQTWEGLGSKADRLADVGDGLALINLRPPHHDRVVRLRLCTLNLARLLLVCAESIGRWSNKTP